MQLTTSHYHCLSPCLSMINQGMWLLHNGQPKPALQLTEDTLKVPQGDAIKHPDYKSNSEKSLEIRQLRYRYYSWEPSS